MDASVYTPGAGHFPPVLAGRDRLIEDWQLALNDVATTGRVRAPDIVLEGPRGVGKTVTLTAFGTHARHQGFEVVNLQAVTQQANLVEALLRHATIRMEEHAGPWQRAKHALDRLAGLGVGFAGASAQLSIHPPEASTPAHDAGTLATALAVLANEVRRDVATGGLLVTVDELQVASPPDLALLAATLHRLNVDHPTAAVMFAGTGLPNVSESMRRAGVTHPDRLFSREPLPLTLDDRDARYAIVEPARLAGVRWHPDAAHAIVAVTNGYPAHLQVFADHTWRLAPGPDYITTADAEAAIPRAGASIEQKTFAPRWDRMSDRQMEMVAALALCGGTATTRQLGTILGRSAKDMSWLRELLIREGDVYVPRRGQLALGVPLFGEFVLARYDEAVSAAEVEVRSLTQMRSLADAPPELPPSAR